jgi:murein DD-endopeptidase MepM/ murein hydrolase activator NlpD
VIRFAVAALAFYATGACAADVTVEGRAEQGGLVIGKVAPGLKVVIGDRDVPVTPGGKFFVGLDRDAPATVELEIVAPDGSRTAHTLKVKPRQWKIEKVNGVPQQLVTPDPETEAKIAAENKLMRAARAQLELTTFYESGLIRPAEGRISGVFGSQRVLNGTPRAPHAGLDIAGPIGTPVHAAADGIVTLQKENMVLTGDTIVLNHGYGLQTTYIHMSKILVKDGERVKQGEVIGEIGMTGRANGPHLHFGVTWFDTRLDPETVLEALPPPLN